MKLEEYVDKLRAVKKELIDLQNNPPPAYELYELIKTCGKRGVRAWQRNRQVVKIDDYADRRRNYIETVTVNVLSEIVAGWLALDGDDQAVLWEMVKSLNYCSSPMDQIDTKGIY